MPYHIKKPGVLVSGDVYWKSPEYMDSNIC